MNLSPQILEAINGFLLIEFAAILWLFARYIVQGIYTYGWRAGRRQRAAAIGVFVLVLGDFVIRLSVWLWRHGVNTGRPISEDTGLVLNATIAVGCAVAAVGGACVIRYFSPARWGEWPWVAVTVLGGLWAGWMAW